MKCLCSRHSYMFKPVEGVCVCVCVCVGVFFVNVNSVCVAGYV